MQFLQSFFSWKQVIVGLGSVLSALPGVIKLISQIPWFTRSRDKRDPNDPPCNCGGTVWTTPCTLELQSANHGPEILVVVIVVGQS